jgi:hypothetical protein
MQNVHPVTILTMSLPAWKASAVLAVPPPREGSSRPTRRFRSCLYCDPYCEST